MSELGKASLSLVLGLLLLLLLSSCSAKKQTQIIVGVASDLAADRFDRIALTVDYVDPEQRVVDVGWRVGQAAKEIALPARFALSAGDEKRRLVEIAVTASLRGALVVARRARLSFVQDRVVFLSMNLIERCVGVKCGEDKTCGEIGCENVTKDSTQLDIYDPDREQSAADAGAADGFPDGLERVDLPAPPPPDSGPSDADGSVDADGPQPDGQPDSAPPSTPCPTTTSSTSAGKSQRGHVAIGALPDGTVIIVKTSAGDPAKVEALQQSGATFVNRGGTHDLGATTNIWDAVVHADGRVHLVYAKGSRTIWQSVLPASGSKWSSESAAYPVPQLSSVDAVAATTAGNRLFVAGGGQDGNGDPVIGVAYQKNVGSPALSGYVVPNASLPSTTGAPGSVRIGSDGTLTVVTVRFLSFGSWALRFGGAITEVKEFGDLSGNFDTAAPVVVSGGTAHIVYFDDIGAQPELFYQRWLSTDPKPGTYSNINSLSSIGDQTLAITVAGADPRVSYLEPSGSFQTLGVSRFKGGAWPPWSGPDIGTVAGSTRLHYQAPRLHAAYSVAPSASGPFDIYYHCVPAP